MFTMGQKIRNMNNTEFYHKELCANDYYSEGETAPSEWFGKLAEHWDVKGQTISRSDFQELMRHRWPLGWRKVFDGGHCTGCCQLVSVPVFSTEKRIHHGCGLPGISV